MWDITVVILDRPRHEQLIAEVRAAGARIKLISDGDLTAAISVAVSGTGVHAVMGIGGAPEGVSGRRGPQVPRWRDPGALQVALGARRRSGRGHGRRRRRHRARLHHRRPRVGQNVVFCATGVTDGELLRGVRFFGGGARTHSLMLSYAGGLVRFIDTVHMWDPGNPPKVRL